ncbi:hypothetical protein KCP73_26490 [Salmonella enterica subsp. enterica]|nr:hypothetical protein KCP73_26490 [Salmonella enterica subsp. enterica]
MTKFSAAVILTLRFSFVQHLRRYAVRRFSVLWRAKRKPTRNKVIVGSCDVLR